MRLSALTRYRIMSYVTGTVLAVLCVVALPLQYVADRPGLGQVGWPLHGFLYIVYVLVGMDLAWRRRWTIPRTVVVLLAGTIPFLAFYMERRITREERAAASAAEGRPDLVVEATRP